MLDLPVPHAFQDAHPANPWRTNAIARQVIDRDLPDRPAAFEEYRLMAES
jgi:hypothetical protein